MKKLCILGNSHTGSLKRAWDRLKESDLGDKFEITFFADRGDLLKNLTAENEYLRSDNTRLERSLSFTSGGLTQIDTNEYDFFLIYGSQLWPYWLYEDAFYSLDFITLSIDKHLEKTQAKHLMAELRKATTKPIFLGHNPILTQHSGCTQFTNDSYNVGMDALNVYLSKKYNAQAIKQPNSTLEEGSICYTKTSFLNNSKRLAIGFDNDNEVHPGDDLIHMNDDFGETWIKHFLEKDHL